MDGGTYIYTSWWTAEREKQLRQYWATELSTNHIAQKMGITKNSVISKARRLNLAVRRYNGTLAGRLEAMAPPPPSYSISLGSVAKDGCRFPFGDPKDKDFHFCGKPVKEGSSYCPDCHAICWLPAPTRKKAAA